MTCEFERSALTNWELGVFKNKVSMPICLIGLFLLFKNAVDGCFFISMFFSSPVNFMSARK